MSCRKVKDVIETGLLYRVRDKVWGKPVFCPDGGRQKGGASLVWAFMRNVGTWRSDAKGQVRKWRTHEDESTDAERRGGSVRSSDEGPVMRMERRG